MADIPALASVVAGTNPLPPIVPQPQLMHRIFNGKRGWLVGTGILAAFLLGFALRFGISGKRVRGSPSLVPVSASTSALPGETENPTHTAPSSRKENPQIVRPPAKDHQEATDAVVHVVQKNETLGGISVDYRGRYDSEFIQEIEKRNPNLIDPNQLRLGQKVLLPTRPAVSTGKSSPAKNAEESIAEKP
jgi:LysM repeat protein